MPATGRTDCRIHAPALKASKKNLSRPVRQIGRGRLSSKFVDLIVRLPADSRGFFFVAGFNGLPVTNLKTHVVGTNVEYVALALYPLLLFTQQSDLMIGSIAAFVAMFHVVAHLIQGHARGTEARGDRQGLQVIVAIAPVAGTWIPGHGCYDADLLIVTQCAFR